MSKWKHWCPNKCGKKVIYRGSGWRTIGKKVYECDNCGSKFTKKEIEEYK